MQEYIYLKAFSALIVRISASVVWPSANTEGCTISCRISTFRGTFTCQICTFRGMKNLNILTENQIHIKTILMNCNS